ncbi:hypothetical protein VTJ83DRAFT_4398 [Remersonia thermophila]|uniref:Uncharacterized protein n=1 Tax=Remersonia thermophila TaxID=72144 RepID=A0ABR4D9V7_9PEZI
MNWDPDEHLLPEEVRDQEDQAKAWYDEPTRVLNRKLQDENLRLKRLLRENGISWDDRLVTDPHDPTKLIWAETPRKRTRTSGAFMLLSPENKHLPKLPTEVQIQILEYAMMSKHPIMDPLCKLNREAMSAAEKARGNQIAIGFLATCRAYHAEGTQFLWKHNTFIFTSHANLRYFANLSLEHRKNIRHIELRIIAKYYDDEPRKHVAPYPSMMNVFMRLIKIKTIPQPKENTLARNGFRSYTWDQVVDFLDALRPPYDPNHPRGKPRPRLLPGLKSMRMDFVNFPDNFLTPSGGPSLHNLASHDLACTLDKLQLTGIPDDDWGYEMRTELTCMVKDDGILTLSDSAFVYTGNTLRSMESSPHWRPEWLPKLVRSWKGLAQEYIRDHKAKGLPPPGRLGHHHPGLPPAPVEEGHPKTQWKERRTLWKRCLITQDTDAEYREWLEFDRLTGLPIKEQYEAMADYYDPEDLLCPDCDILHGDYNH